MHFLGSFYRLCLVGGCIIVDCGSCCRFFLYVFLAAIVVLLAVGAQQMLGSFGVSSGCLFLDFSKLFAKYVALSKFCVLCVEMEPQPSVLHLCCLFSG